MVQGHYKDAESFGIHDVESKGAAGKPLSCVVVWFLTSVLEQGQGGGEVTCAVAGFKADEVPIPVFFSTIRKCEGTRLVLFQRAAC